MKKFNYTTCPTCRSEVRNISTHKCNENAAFFKVNPFINEISKLLNEGYSLLHIADNSELLFGTSLAYHHILSTCKKLGLKTPTISDTANSKLVREKYKSTVENVYGVGITNVSQASVIKEKKLQTSRKKYGVDNVFQLAEVQKKSKLTMLEKYGVEHPIELPRSNTGRTSKLHAKISDFLTNSGIYHENERTALFRKFNESIGRVYSPIPDIFIPELNFVLEIYGNLWHMNPMMYKSTDKVRLFDGEFTGEEIWKRDLIRRQHIESFGVSVLEIWEKDIIEDFDSVTNLITEKINEKINASSENQQDRKGGFDDDTI